MDRSSWDHALVGMWCTHGVSLAVSEWHLAVLPVARDPAGSSNDQVNVSEGRTSLVRRARPSYE